MYMKFWRRMRNLWKLSAYKPNEIQALIKDFSTIQKKPATIIMPEKVDIFTQENVEASQ